MATTRIWKVATHLPRVIDYAKDGAKTSYPKKRSEAGGYEKKTEFAPKKEYGNKKRDQSDKPRVKKKREE